MLSPIYARELCGIALICSGKKKNTGLHFSRVKREKQTWSRQQLRLICMILFRLPLEEKVSAHADG